MQINYILFHAKSVKPFRPCMDGLFAAYAASLAISSRRVPALYGKVPAIAPQSGDTIYLLDVTYPAYVLEGWADAGAKVVVLDHHKTALNDLSGLSNRVSQTFDMHRSGAVLAWQHFFSGQDVPELFRYVQDRDLWTKQLPGCDFVHLGLTEVLEGKTVAQAIALIPDLTVEGLMQIGRTVQPEVDAAIQSAIEAAADRRTWRIVNGELVPFFVCRSDRQKQAYSDIGSALIKHNPTAPFVVVQTGGGWALRSANDRLDVSAIAKTLGGGGHRNASGCRADLPTGWWKFWSKP